MPDEGYGAERDVVAMSGDEDKPDAGGDDPGDEAEQ